MYRIQRRLLSQNFLHSPYLVDRLVASTFLNKSDLVLEIGPGKGIITASLLKRVGHVIAVEIDAHWYKYVQRKFSDQRHLTVYNKDFLDFPLPALPYSVVANVPFSIEGKILRKLLNDPHPPRKAWLVVMSEFAMRISSQAPSLFLAQYGPWFRFEVAHQFHRTDFTPIPQVNAALLHFSQKSEPLLEWKVLQKYQKFVERGYLDGQAVCKNLRRFYDQQKIEKAFQKLSLSRKLKPNQISLQTWIQLYKLCFE